ncbi:helical backbone metal receptor [Polaribacter litorisediminis]|uniref:ABC transporter substrate-binding protein n=1 Tax=Polaribacter litorisediminis TaxID=1908341 RepID=UPI001CC10E9E|nr:helical backbone metal receptor [Polaribacter litorisediminis]UAM98774.1 helical backbone metal receptor [Polaribacter litorisediminis]
MLIKDQLHTTLEIKNTPTRIICLVPSITELLVDLGLEDSIVGITKFCIHPNGLIKKKTVVGGTKNIKVDVIKHLKPDIILCNKEENTKDIVENCRQIATTHVSDIFTIADTLQLIHQYGEIFSCEEKAREQILKIENKKIDFLNFIKDKKDKKVAYFIWKTPWMVVGNNTFINHLLEVNNFKNVFQHKNRYPEINLTDLHKEQDLDFIFLSSEPYPFGEKHILELENTFKKTQIILVDGEFFSWYGTRLLFAFDYFKKLHRGF